MKNNINILEFIPVGRKNALSMPELTLRSGLKDDTRTARKLVFEARRRGEIICSVCSKNANGYYRPALAEEALPYIRLQESRIHSAQEALKSAKQFAEAGGRNG